MVTSLFVFFLGLKNASQSKELLKSHRERDVEQESHFEPVHRKDVVLAKTEMRRRLKTIIYRELQSCRGNSLCHKIDYSFLYSWPSQCR